MNWFNKHVNLSYTAIIVVALLFLFLEGFVRNNVMGYYVWMVLLLVSSWWILWRKGRSPLYLVLTVLVTAVGIPILLYLSNRRVVQ